MTQPMLTRMAIASHNFFRTKYTLLPPWDELPPEAQETGVEHAKAVLLTMAPMTGGMYSALCATNVMSKDTNSERVWAGLLAAAVAGK